jgi:creatinine amidohydrolase
VDDGLSILRERQERLPSVLRGALAAAGELPPFEGVRAVVTTGVGSSLAHARFLSWLLRERRGLPSWDAPTGAWLSAPPPAAREQALVVFSQGLSPNARFPLAHADRYRLAVLVTAASEDSPERAAAVRAARERGVVVVPLGCPPEYEVLLRLVGPAVGYAVALRLAGVPVDADAVASAVRDAAVRARGLLSTFDPRGLAEPIVLVGTHGYTALAHNLAAKVQEGMFLPSPTVVDALELAHGTLQEATGKPRTFIALARGVPHEEPLLARVRSTLEPQHRWLTLSARLPEPLPIFEHEAMMNELVLAAGAARRLNQRSWPGKGRDGALYSLASTADLEAPTPPSPPLPPSTRSRRLVDLTWPEVEQRVAGGDRTVVLPLGAIEQHGPHLPLEVDALVADALGERLCARLPHSLLAPTLALGCSAEHLGFAGTLSLSPSTLAAVLGDVVTSLAAHGFEHVVVFSAHGGNDGTLAEVAGALRERARPARVTVVHGVDRVSALWQAASLREGISPRESGHHAGEYETSIMAALRPDAVRWNELREGASGDVPDPQTLFYPSLRAHAEDGVVGDPRRAAADRAERYLGAWVDHLVDACRAGGADG